MNKNEIISIFDEEFNKFKSNILEAISEENEIQKEEYIKDTTDKLIYELEPTELYGTKSIDTDLQLLKYNKEFTVVLKATISNDSELKGNQRIIDFGVSRIWIDSNGSLCMTTQKNVISLSAFGNEKKGKTFNIIVTHKLDKNTNSYKITYYIYNGNKKVIESYHIEKNTESNVYFGGSKSGDFFKGTIEAKVCNYAFNNEEINNVVCTDFTGVKVNNLDF